MSRAGLSLGADLGGSWLRLCLADSSGRPLKRARLPAPDKTLLLPALSRQLAAWGKPRLARLALGATGLWRRGDQRQMARRLRALARRVAVVSDLELAHAAAFGGRPGVLLVAGTGSAALARAKGSRLKRAGGWGPLLGDEGSAFWLGREALKDPKLSRSWPLGLPLRLARDPRCVRKTAALARIVLARAKRDAAARALRRRAAKALAALVREAARGLRGPSPWPVCAHGSLFRDAALLAEVRARLPVARFRLQAPLMTAERAAATLEIRPGRSIAMG